MNIYDTNHSGIPLKTDFSYSLKCLSNYICERRVLSGSFIDWIKIFNIQEHYLIVLMGICWIWKIIDLKILGMSKAFFLLLFIWHIYEKRHRKKRKTNKWFCAYVTHVECYRNKVLSLNHIMQFRHSNINLS